MVSTSPRVTRFLAPSVEDELLELGGDEHHVRAEGVHEFAGGVRFDLDSRRFASATIHAGHRLHRRGPARRCRSVAERFADSVVAVLVLHVHAARVGGDADVVGDEEEQRLRIRRAEIGVDARQILLFSRRGCRALQIADEDDLEGRHEGRRLRAVERLEDADFREVEIGEAEVAEVWRDEAWRGRPCGNARRGRRRRQRGRSRGGACSLSGPRENGRWMRSRRPSSTGYREQVTGDREKRSAVGRSAKSF